MPEEKYQNMDKQLFQLKLDHPGYYEKTVQSVRSTPLQTLPGQDSKDPALNEHEKRAILDQYNIDKKIVPEYIKNLDDKYTKETVKESKQPVNKSTSQSIDISDDEPFGFDPFDGPINVSESEIPIEYRDYAKNSEDINMYPDEKKDQSEEKPSNHQSLAKSLQQQVNNLKKNHPGYYADALKEAQNNEKQMQAKGLGSDPKDYQTNINAYIMDKYELDHDKDPLNIKMHDEGYKGPRANYNVHSIQQTKADKIKTNHPGYFHYALNEAEKLETGRNGANKDPQFVKDSINEDIAKSYDFDKEYNPELINKKDQQYTKYDHFIPTLRKHNPYEKVVLYDLDDIASANNITKKNTPSQENRRIKALKLEHPSYFRQAKQHALGDRQKSIKNGTYDKIFDPTINETIINQYLKDKQNNPEAIKQADQIDKTKYRAKTATILGKGKPELHTSELDRLKINHPTYYEEHRKQAIANVKNALKQPGNPVTEDALSNINIDNAVLNQYQFDKKNNQDIIRKADTIDDQRNPHRAKIIVEEPKSLSQRIKSGLSKAKAGLNRALDPHTIKEDFKAFDHILEKRAETKKQIQQQHQMQSQAKQNDIAEQKQSKSKDSNLAY